MGDYSFRVKLGNDEIEAHAGDPTTLVRILNAGAKKFLAVRTGLSKDDMKI